MHIQTAATPYANALRRLADDPNSVSAVAESVRDTVSVPHPRSGPQGLPEPVVLSDELPVRPVLPPEAPSGVSDRETIEILLRKTVLPGVKGLVPEAAPAITGVQAVFATKDFWDAISGEEIDRTRLTIEGVKSLQLVADTFLRVTGAPAAATQVNMLAGLVIATADALYLARQESSRG